MQKILSIDLALLKLDLPFTFSKSIKSIPLNDIEENLVGRKVKVSGWGKTEKELYPTRLRATTLKVTEHMDMNRMARYGRHGYGIGMSFDQNAAGRFCQGDSGGKCIKTTYLPFQI